MRNRDCKTSVNRIIASRIMARRNKQQQQPQHKQEEQEKDEQEGLLLVECVSASLSSQSIPLIILTNEMIVTRQQTKILLFLLCKV